MRIRPVADARLVLLLLSAPVDIASAQVPARVQTTYTPIDAEGRAESDHAVKRATLVGVALIILGVLALAYQGIACTRREGSSTLGRSRPRSRKRAFPCLRSSAPLHSPGAWRWSSSELESRSARPPRRYPRRTRCRSQSARDRAGRARRIWSSAHAHCPAAVGLKRRADICDREADRVMSPHRALSGLFVFVPDLVARSVARPAPRIVARIAAARDSISLSVNTLMAMRLELIGGIPENLKYVIFHNSHVTRPPDAPPLARQP